MNILALIFLIACVAPGAAVLIVFWRLCFGVAPLPPTTAWIDEFSVDRYRPMLWLLKETDVRSPRPPSSVRRERCRSLRGYLRSLATDFNQILAALKLVMAQASSDRPDLASLLIRSQASFAVYLLLAHVQLLLYAFGIGRVDVGALLNVVEGMRLELRTLVPRTVDSAG